MKIIRIFGLCLAIVIALSATATASASAEEILFETPEHGFPISFTVSTAAGGISVHTENGMTLTCATMGTNANIGRADIETAHLGGTKLALTECKSTVGGIPVKCKNTDNEGEIVITVLFHIGYFPATHPAILFLPENFLFTCAGAAIGITGEVIGLLENNMGEPVHIGGKYEELYVKFLQHEGKQEHLEFLLSLTGELMKNQDLKVKIGTEEKLAGLEGTVKFSNFEPKPVGFEI